MMLKNLFLIAMLVGAVAALGCDTESTGDGVDIHFCSRAQEIAVQVVAQYGVDLLSQGGAYQGAGGCVHGFDPPGWGCLISNISVIGS